MSGGVGHLMLSGPLILAAPVAAVAGAVTFLSPCVLPLVPGYLSYVTGMTGVDAEGQARGGAAAKLEPVGGPGTVAVKQTAAPAVTRPARRRTVAGTALFVLGFTAVFASEGVLFGGLGSLLQRHSAGLTQVLGCVTILLGLLFAGVFDRFPVTGRIMRPSVRPRAGLAGAPVLGVLFGLSWTPCLGPTIGVVMLLATTSGTAVRGAILMVFYGLGLGIPFLIVALAFQRSMAMFGFARRHARAISLVGGAMLVAVGVLEVTGAWGSLLTWMKIHWIAHFQSPI
jgi:cytochrome c-type biogenesis protein